MDEAGSYNRYRLCLGLSYQDIHALQKFDPRRILKAKIFPPLKKEYLTRFIVEDAGHFGNGF
jgi:hypothetical protein